MSVLGDGDLAGDAGSTTGEPVLDGRRSWARPVGLALAVTGVVAVLGPLVGLTWRAVAPRVPGALGFGWGYAPVVPGFGYAEPQPEQAMAADGWFAFLGLGLGAVLALSAWVLLRQRRGLPVLVGLVLGSVLGAWLAWLVGVELDQARFEELARGVTQQGTIVEAPLALHVTDLDPGELWPPKPTGVVLAQALAAAIVYTTLAGFAADPHLRPVSMRPADDEPGDDSYPAWRPVSSGPGAPSGPPASPAPPGSV